MSTNTLDTRLKELLPELFESQKQSGEAFLKFKLTPEKIGAISLKLVEETLLIPTEMITPIPNLPQSILGLMNTQERVFLGIDLPLFIGVAHKFANLQRHTVIVVRLPSVINEEKNDPHTSEDIWIGLAVHQIQGLMRLLPEEIATIQEGIPNLNTSLQGIITQNQEEIMLLSIEKLAHKFSQLSKNK